MLTAETIVRASRRRTAGFRSLCGVMATAWLGMIIAATCLGQIAPTDFVCSAGSGSFEAQFHTGVSVRVGASRNGALATRSCDAILSWGKQEVDVATGVAQLDVDAFGIDLGLGAPVVTFQVKKSDAECCMAYQIYSMQKVPRLLRSITGGALFSANDKDLDGRVEIWTNDAAAVNGFEGLSLAEVEPPDIVLRFAGRRLLDASSEFRPYFDEKITKLQAGVDLQDQRDFKNSDGRLWTLTATLSAERLHRLRRMKAQALGIVWLYLYSGREPEAWRSLAEMWPAQDIDRIRAAISDMRSRGILVQVDGVTADVPSSHKKRAKIFDAIARSQSASKLEVVPPEPILLQRPSLETHEITAESETVLDLVIDSAGKVRSAEPAGNKKHIDKGLIASAEKWRFIPAFKDGSPVASRLRLSVSPKQ